MYYSLPMLNNINIYSVPYFFVRAMLMANNDNFLDDLDDDDDFDQESEIESLELAEKKAAEQAQKNLIARRRIDELMEKKRLKELLDDEDDW